MALTSGGKVHTPRSTGAVKTPEAPTTVTQTVDRASTDAVACPEPVEVLGAVSGVEVSTPTPGPVTMTVSWLPDDDQEDGEVETQTKVVTPPKKAPAKSTAKAETK